MEHILVAWGSAKKIVARNVQRDLWRSGLAFAMIALSFSLPIVMSASQVITLGGTEDTIRSLSISDIIVMTGDVVDNSFAQNLTTIDEGTLIHATSPSLIVPQKTILLNNKTGEGVKTSTSLLAIDPHTYTRVMMPPIFSDDTPPNAFSQLQANGTILTEPIAESLGVVVGDMIQVRYTNYLEITTPIVTDSGVEYEISYVPMMLWANFTVVGVIQGAYMEQYSIGAFSLAETSYIAYQGLTELYPEFEGNASMFFVKAQPDQDLQTVERRIRAEFGEEYELIIITFEDILTRLNDLITNLFNTFDLITVFSVVNSGLGVLTIMIMNISERKREIGILRSQGMSWQQVLTTVIGEALILGIIGVIAAVVLGLIWELITLSYMVYEGFPTQPFVVPWFSIRDSIGYAVGVSVLGSLIPGWQAARIKIIDALRYT
jgi:ABC-type antimicrobial peptide transport system permease subunit